MYKANTVYCFAADGTINVNRECKKGAWSHEESMLWCEVRYELTD